MKWPGFFDPLDPQLRPAIGARQIEVVTAPRHVLLTIGMNDTFTGTLALETMTGIVLTDPPIEASSTSPVTVETVVHWPSSPVVLARTMALQTLGPTAMAWRKNPN